MTWLRGQRSDVGKTEDIINGLLAATRDSSGGVAPMNDGKPPLKWLPIEALSAGGPPLLRKLLRLGLVR